MTGHKENHKALRHLIREMTLMSERFRPGFDAGLDQNMDTGVSTVGARDANIGGGVATLKPKGVGTPRPVGADDFPYTSGPRYEMTPEEEEEFDADIETAVQISNVTSADLSRRGNWYMDRATDRGSLGKNVPVLPGVAEEVAHRSGISPIARLYPRKSSGPPIGSGNANHAFTPGPYRRTGDIGWTQGSRLPAWDLLYVLDDDELEEVDSYFEDEDSEDFLDEDWE
jgi:hypothetical protein